MIDLFYQPGRQLIVRNGQRFDHYPTIGRLARKRIASYGLALESLANAFNSSQAQRLGILREAEAWTKEVTAKLTASTSNTDGRGPTL
jgi:hypothetical protein